MRVIGCHAFHLYEVHGNMLNYMGGGGGASIGICVYTCTCTRSRVDTNNVGHKQLRSKTNAGYHDNTHKSQTATWRGKLKQRIALHKVVDSTEARGFGV